MKIPSRMLKVVLLLAAAAVPAQPASLPGEGRGTGAVIIAYSYGPAQVWLTGPDGGRTGVDPGTGEVVEEISGSDVSVEKAGDRWGGRTVEIQSPRPGLYGFHILGMGTGRIVIDLEVRDDSGRVTRSHVLRRVEAGDRFRYVLDYDPRPGRGHRLVEILE